MEPRGSLLKRAQPLNSGSHILNSGCVTLSSLTIMHFWIFFHRMGSIMLALQWGLLELIYHFYCLSLCVYLFLPVLPNADSLRAEILVCHQCPQLLLGTYQLFSNSFWRDEWANVWPVLDEQCVPHKYLTSFTPSQPHSGLLAVAPLLTFVAA